MCRYLVESFRNTLHSYWILICRLPCEAPRCMSPHRKSVSINEKLGLPLGNNQACWWRTNQGWQTQLFNRGCCPQSEVLYRVESTLTSKKTWWLTMMIQMIANTWISMMMGIRLLQFLKLCHETTDSRRWARVCLQRCWCLWLPARTHSYGAPCKRWRAAACLSTTGAI